MNLEPFQSLQSTADKAVINDTNETYLVATNPDLEHPLHQALHPLFSGESQTKPAHKQGPKLYNFYLLHLVINGKGYFQTDRGRYQLGKNDIFLIRPHELVSYESDHIKPWHYVWVAFKGELAESMLLDCGFTKHDDVLHVKHLEYAIAQCRMIYETFRQRKQAASLKANGLIHLLLASLQETQPQHQSTLSELKHEHPIAKQMVHYITTQYVNPITIELMADTFGYNRAYLSRLFKQYTGLSPRTYLLHYRLDQARHLLRTRPDLTIEQISASVGIQDSLYFSKQFKLYTKQSPTTYRAQLRA